MYRFVYAKDDLYSVIATLYRPLKMFEHTNGKSVANLIRWNLWCIWIYDFATSNGFEMKQFAVGSTMNRLNLLGNSSIENWFPLKYKARQTLQQVLLADAWNWHRKTTVASIQQCQRQHFYIRNGTVAYTEEQFFALKYPLKKCKIFPSFICGNSTIISTTIVMN